jgi:hypothetical protein
MPNNPSQKPQMHTNKAKEGQYNPQITQMNADGNIGNRNLRKSAQSADKKS